MNGDQQLLGGLKNIAANICLGLALVAPDSRTLVIFL